MPCQSDLISLHKHAPRWVSYKHSYTGYTKKTKKLILLCLIIAKLHSLFVLTSIYQVLWAHKCLLLLEIGSYCFIALVQIWRLRVEIRKLSIFEDRNVFEIAVADWFKFWIFLMMKVGILQRISDQSCSTMFCNSEWGWYWT